MLNGWRLAEPSRALQSDSIQATMTDTLPRPPPPPPPPSPGRAQEARSSSGSSFFASCVNRACTSSARYLAFVEQHPKLLVVHSCAPLLPCSGGGGGGSGRREDRGEQGLGSYGDGGPRRQRLAGQWIASASSSCPPSTNLTIHLPQEGDG